MKTKTLITQIAAFGLMVSLAEGETFRYNGGGDWTKISNGDNGWGINPNNPPANPGSLPGAGDDARVNFASNTVTVTTDVPDVNRVQVGVDEDGNLVIADGGILTSLADTFIGNNNDDVDNATLTVQSGGVLNVGGRFWTSNNASIGNISIESGGVVNAANHLWFGVTNTSIISIAGTLTQTAGILGLGTNNAATPTGGSATVNVEDGGILALNNIHGEGTSIQDGSILNINGSGQVTLPGDFVDVIWSYVDNEKISGNSVLGRSALVVDLDTNPGFTTITSVPVVDPDTTPVFISNITFDQITEDITLTWDSEDGEQFVIRYGVDLISWDGELEDQYEADPGVSTSFTVNRSALLGATTASKVYFQVDRVASE